MAGTMLQTLDVGERPLKAYRGLAPEPLLDALVPLDQSARR